MDGLAPARPLSGVGTGGDAMNTRRVAALLRELAAALEQADEQPKAKRRPLAIVAAPPVRPEMVAKVRRSLRRQGIA